VILKRLSLLLLLICSEVLLAQFANDCADAIVVCGNSQIESNSRGFGIQELDNTSNPCSFEEVNSLWFRLNIAESGKLAFDITPDGSSLSIDYDFYIFGPSNRCGNFDAPIRCSTTNPNNAMLSYNTTGLRGSERENSEGPGADGNSYVASLDVLAGEVYYLLIDRPHGSGGFSLDWTGTAEFNDFPEINEPNDIELCIGSSETDIDLTVNNTVLTSEPGLRFSYFENLANAYDETDKIEDPEHYNSPFPLSTIYAKVRSANGCFEIKSFQVYINEFLNVSDFNYVLCDQNADGLERFSINEIKDDIASLLSDSSLYEIQLFENSFNVENDINPINLNFIESPSNILFARVSAVNVTDCTTIFPISLEVVSSPIPERITLLQCDVDKSDSTDGITLFNLEQLFVNDIYATYDFQLYSSEEDQRNNIPIEQLIGYKNTLPFSQIIYYTATNSRYDCINEGTIELNVQPTTASLSSQSPYYSCQTNTAGEAILGTFDLDAIATQEYPNLDVAFFENLTDLTLELNTISGAIETVSRNYYVRIEDAGQCQGVEVIELIVNPLPEIDFPKEIILCTDGSDLALNAPTGFDHYEWFQGNNANSTPITLGPDISINSPGEYILRIGKINQGNTVCFNEHSFNVIPSNIARIKNVIIKDGKDENSIEIIAEGDGIYLYSLDGFTYQESTFFNAIDPGIITIYIKDLNECGIRTDEVSVVGFPKFFTPNQDGTNDHWQIIGLNENYQPSSQISIFNRYGKFLKQVSVTEKGWDGSYNNKALPPDDYWYKAKLEDGRVLKGHFSLKR